LNTAISKPENAIFNKLASPAYCTRHGKVTSTEKPTNQANHTKRHCQQLGVTEMYEISLMNLLDK
jgi:hypothetical protein